MATKAEIQAKIDAIATGEENTALEVRTFANGLLDEFFTDPIADTQALEILTSSIYGGIIYALVFKKIGNNVTVNGTIRPGTATGVGGADLIAFTDANFAPSDDVWQVFKQEGIIFKFNNGKITALNQMVGTTYYLNQTYVTD